MQQFLAMRLYASHDIWDTTGVTTSFIKILDYY